jgi:hypothetical protein
LLTAEHANLAASRSMVQSEVLARITIFLTLVSAGLVSLALVGQATNFGGSFPLFAVSVLALETVVGFLTQLRVLNAGMEDLMYVLAMNRIRAGYLELDPGLAPQLMSGVTDDRAGSLRTYYFLGSRGSLSQVGGSSMILIVVVTGALAGLFVAALSAAFGASTWLEVVLGVVGALAWYGISIWRGESRYRRFWLTWTPHATVEAN